MQTNQISPQSAISGTSALGQGTGFPLKPGGQGGANGVQNPLVQRGQVLNGSVIGTLGDKVALRLGQTRWIADSTLPLSVGQKIQVQVDGELDGKVALRLLTLDRSLAFSKLEMGDLANHLSSLRLPQSDENMAGARALLEFNVPLTRENLESMRNALSQLGRFSDTQLTAAAFLKGAEAPLTPQNINTLAHFLTTQPMIGLQLLEFQNAFRKMVRSGSPGRDSDRFSGILNEIPIYLQELLVDLNRQKKDKVSQTLRKSATRAGAQKNSEKADPIGRLVSSLARDMEENWGDSQVVRAVLEKAQEVKLNWEAQGLLNSKKDTEEAFLYFQVPALMGKETATAQVRIKARPDGHGGVFVDDDNTHIELTIGTEVLGDMHFTLDLRRKDVVCRIGASSSEVEDLVAEELPSFKGCLEKLGLGVSRMTCETEEVEGKEEGLWGRETMEDMERLDIKV